MPNQNTFTSIEKRRSLKLLSEQPLPAVAVDEQLVKTLMQAAYWAPFHYPVANKYRENSSQTAPMPWRFYVLSASTCRTLASRLCLDEKSKKIIQTLNACDYLFIQTWCPTGEVSQAPLAFSGDLINMEHLAGAGASAQNLLLAATEQGFETFWSSGGVLRQEEWLKAFGAHEDEILLSALFLFKSGLEQVPAENQFTSKRRDSRGDLANSYAWVSL